VIKMELGEDFTKQMDKIFDDWKNNWNQTLSAHKKEINDLSEKISVIDDWSNCLLSVTESDRFLGAKQFLSEMFMDSYTSLVLVSLALYKYANMCLRSYLESTMRLIYFSVHPIEYKWWTNNLYEHSTFTMHLDFVSKLERFHKVDPRKTTLIAEVRNLYKKLSSYVHTEEQAFQTKERLSPKYSLEKFEGWEKTFRDTISYSNILLLGSFYENYQKLRVDTQERILRIGIANKKHELIKSLGDKG